MTKYLLFISVFIIANDIPQKEIVASYAAISCSCAQWKMEGEKENVYLERENEELPDVNKLWDGETFPFQVAVKGKFKKHLGVPRGFSVKNRPKEARIFVYNQLRILKK